MVGMTLSFVRPETGIVPGNITTRSIACAVAGIFPDFVDRCVTVIERQKENQEEVGQEIKHKCLALFANSHT